MKEGIEILYTLQQHDDKTCDIKAVINDIPKKIKALEDERDQKADMLSQIKSNLEDNKKDRTKFEKDILSIKEKISKKRDQLSKATTNKEYQGLTQEIKFEEEAISKVEEKIIEKMLESDEILVQFQEKESEYNTIKEDYNKKIQDFKTDLSYQNQKLEEHNSKRDVIRKDIPANLMRVYDSLAVKKGGKSISFVESDFCGTCNVKIRPQLMSQIIASASINFCENCGRVLYKKIVADTKDTK